MKKRLLQNKELSPIKKISVGIVIIDITYLSLAVIISAFAFSKNYAPSKYGFLSAVAFTLAGAIGSFINAKMLKSNIKSIILSTSLTDALYLLTVLLINGKIIGEAVMNSVCFILASLVFAYLSSVLKKNTRRKNRHY